MKNGFSFFYVIHYDYVSSDSAPLGMDKNGKSENRSFESLSITIIARDWLAIGLKIHRETIFSPFFFELSEERNLAKLVAIETLTSETYRRLKERPNFIFRSFG